MIKYYLDIAEDGEIVGRYIDDNTRQIPVGITEVTEAVYIESLNFSHYIDGVFTNVLPEPTEEELLAQFKRDREQAVSQITVTVDNMVFDGDETSQDRMSRAIVSLDPLETTLWVLHDNTVAYPTREQLKDALRLAGLAQTAIWVQE